MPAGEGRGLGRGSDALPAAQEDRVGPVAEEGPREEEVHAPVAVDVREARKVRKILVAVVVRVPNESDEGEARAHDEEGDDEGADDEAVDDGDDFVDIERK